MKRRFVNYIVQYSGLNPKDVKLLYVSITRALHELYFLGNEKITRLIKEKNDNSALPVL